jgi:hypothetical protein
VEDMQSERIAKAEEGLAEAQQVLDQAKRAVDAADRAERAAREASDHARSFARIAVIVAGVIIALVMTGAAFRRRGETSRWPLHLNRARPARGGGPTDAQCQTAFRERSAGTAAG